MILFLRWKLALLCCSHLYCSALLGGCSPLWLVLLVRSRRSGNKFNGMRSSARSTVASLSIWSLILLHDVLESLLVEVAARFMFGGLIDSLGTARCMGNHQVLLVTRSRDLGLHLQVAQLSGVVLLLAETQYHLVNNFMRWVWGLWTCWNQIWIFLSHRVFGLMVILHSCKLLPTWNYRSMSNSFTRLGIEMTSYSGRISTCNLAFYLFPPLALAYIAAKTRFLLGRAILTVTDWDRRSFPPLIPSRRGRRLIRLQSVSVGSGQSIAVVLAAVRNRERLTLQLLLAHLVIGISNELLTSWGLLKGQLFFT